MISETLKKITNNFESGFRQSTLMGWTPKFDIQGRPLNTDPNYRRGEVLIEDKTYWFIRKGWIVRIYDNKTDYTKFHDTSEYPFIEEVGLTPDYVKEREDYKKPN